MNVPEIYWLITVAYVVSWSITLAVTFNRKLGKKGEKISYLLFLVFNIFHLNVLLYSRLYDMANTFNPALYFINEIAGLIIFAYLIIGPKYRLKLFYKLTLPAMSISFLTIGMLISGGQINAKLWLDQDDILEKYTLILHIFGVVAGHALFGVACFASILFLREENQIKGKNILLKSTQMPSLGTLDQTSYRAIRLGFLCMTIGIFSGLAIGGSADTAMRQFRLIGAFVIWGMYAGFLLERILKSYHRRFNAIWTIVGFVMVFCYFIIEIVHLNA